MNILQDIVSGQNGAIVSQLASQFGLDGQQVESAIGQLVPALARGVRNNSRSNDGLQSLMNALQTGNHQRYIEQPEALSAQDTITDGNAILGHLFGSKEVSREVASRAAEQTGIGSSVLKQMLPVLATAVMGSLSKQTQSSGSPLQGLLSQFLGGGSSSASSDMMGMLGSFLDADKDGSCLDDVMGMLAKRAG